MTSVLLETLLPANNEKRNIWMENPERILQTNELSRVSAVLSEVDEAVSSGAVAIGFLSYEAGYHFLPNMPELTRTSFPFVWFAVGSQWEEDVPPDFEVEGNVSLEDLSLDTTSEEYEAQIARIRDQIERGNTYQVNYTMRYRGEFHGSSRALYSQLRQKQRVPYAAYLETLDWTILSLSPELFFRKTGPHIEMRPMKGTSRRGRTNEEDAQLSEQLSSSEKERAENLMIVDLLRNDLGKVCEPGTIQVTRPLMVERYDTVLQMTSQIEALTNKDLGLVDFMKALFPSGSVTGAPKVRTMQIIHDLEKAPRKIYTGSIGFVSREETVFSVAIRTALIQNGRLEMGVGSGILHEADAQREYEECRLKGRFLSDPPLKFELIETLLWLPESGYQRIDLHLDRLQDSAAYFGFPCDRDRTLQFLEQNSPGTKYPRRVRFLLDANGKMTLHTTELETLLDPKIRWAHQAICSEDRFLYHKTTYRSLYQQELADARARGATDVIFRNERGEITEGALSNIWILKNGIYSTPPVSCGLLNGTFRRFLLSRNDFEAIERVLFPEDLEGADEVYISNAIRGLLRVQLDLSSSF